MQERVQVVLDLYVEVDEEEFNVELDREEGSEVDRQTLKESLIEQIEEAVKDSGNGSSIGLSFAEENTTVRFL